MGREVALLVAAAVAGVAPVARGQATGMPSFNAPYRAFLRSEFGAVFSFPDGGGTGIEGAYRYASGKLDVGLRGGIFDPPGSAKAVLLAGVESLGRRIDPQGSTVSIVPYVQPTVAFIVGDFPSDLVFGFGVGVDFRLSKVLDARVSGGLGDHPFTGVSIGAVWVH